METNRSAASTEGRQTRFVVLAVLLVVAVVACCVVSAMAVSGVSAMRQELKDLLQTVEEENDTSTREDDVVVADEYTIRSTKTISDAYLSGDTSQLSDREKETLDMATSVLEQIITDGMTDYEKEKAVYDWMCANLQSEDGITVAIPTTSQDSAEPYGVLKYHKAVCVGYATTFRMLMQMMEIDCMVVHNSYHSWDLVKLDGDWYHTDIYSDMGKGDYANFNMTDTLCAESHSWDAGFWPSATGVKYCYAYQNAQKLDDIYSIPMMVRQMMDDGGGTLFITFGDQTKTWYDQAQRMLNQIQNALGSGLIASDKDSWMDYTWSQVDQEYLLSVTVYIYGGEEASSANVTEEQQARINEALSEAFDQVDWGDVATDSETWDETDSADWENDPTAIVWEEVTAG